MHLFRYLVFKSAYPSFTQMQQTLLCWASFLPLVLLDQIEIASCLGHGKFVAGYPFDIQALDCILYSLYINYVPAIKRDESVCRTENGDPKIWQSCFVINVPCFYHRTTVHRTSYSQSTYLALWSLMAVLNENEYLNKKGIVFAVKHKLFWCGWRHLGKDEAELTTFM